MNAPHSSRQMKPADILDTSTSAAARRWDDLLTLQTDIFFASEVNALLNNGSWQRAGSVLDVGCGNGSYLARLAALFPEKTFSGIDRSPALIASAKARPSRADFSVCDYFDVPATTRTDAILMRFVVQHLTDLGAILRKADELLAHGGSVFVIEPDLAGSVNVPPTPLFMAMLAGFESDAARAGRLRGKLDRLASLAAPHWIVAGESRVNVLHAGTAAGEPMSNLFGLWIDVCEQSATEPPACGPIRQEIRHWSRQECFSRVGLRLIELKRAESG